MTEHAPIYFPDFQELENSVRAITSEESTAVINHLRYSSQHNPMFMMSPCTEGEDFQGQVRAHYAALIRGEISIADLE